MPDTADQLLADPWGANYLEKDELYAAYHDPITALWWQKIQHGAGFRRDLATFVLPEIDRDSPEALINRDPDYEGHVWERLVVAMGAAAIPAARAFLETPQGPGRIARVTALSHAMYWQPNERPPKHPTPTPAQMSRYLDRRIERNVRLGVNHAVLALDGAYWFVKDRFPQNQQLDILLRSAKLIAGPAGQYDLIEEAMFSGMAAPPGVEMHPKAGVSDIIKGTIYIPPYNYKIEEDVAHKARVAWRALPAFDPNHPAQPGDKRLRKGCPILREEGPVAAWMSDEQQRIYKGLWRLCAGAYWLIKHGYRSSSVADTALLVRLPPPYTDA
jgi:hypothetical protein